LKEEFIKYALDNIVSGKFRVNIDRVIDWKDIQKGHEAMERNEIMGKIVCTVD
jgi:NADPH:quinone reductase-like Zn-dependent oxidoreductase